MSLRLRPTMLSDLDWVVSVERDAANLPFITAWERTQHEGAIRFPDSRHFIVEEGDALERIGFVILQGCRNPNGSVELKRLVLRRLFGVILRQDRQILEQVSANQRRFEHLPVKPLDGRQDLLGPSIRLLIEGGERLDFEERRVEIQL